VKKKILNIISNQSIRKAKKICKLGVLNESRVFFLTVEQLSNDKMRSNWNGLKDGSSIRTKNDITSIFLFQNLEFISKTINFFNLLEEKNVSIDTIGF
jgi:hypothetical protein